MPNKHVQGNYRYAYQGQEKDPETGMEAFELRLWDGRIGRWLTVDPYGQYDSPYLGMGNNPISNIDPDGGAAGGPCGGEGQPPCPNPPIDGGLAGLSDMPVEQLDAVVINGSSNPHDISNGINSHLVPSFGMSQDLGAIGNISNGGIALPQDFGDWASAGSDGRQYIGCMSCHGNNGAYRTLAYDSPSRYAGLAIAGTFNAAYYPGGLSSGSSSSKAITYTINANRIHMAVDVAEDNYVIMSGTVHGVKTQVGGFFTKSGGAITINGADFAGEIGITGIRNFAKEFANANGVKNVFINTAKRTTGANPGKVQMFHFNF